MMSILYTDPPRRCPMVAPFVSQEFSSPLQRSETKVANYAVANYAVASYAVSECQRGFK